MKKLILLFITMLILFLSTASMMAEDDEFAKNAGSAYVIEYSTGTIIYKKNETSKMYPASMTKMMSLILVFDALNTHAIEYTDIVTTSSYASSMGGSQIYLEENEEMSVMDLLKSICIASANDAMVSLAEKVAGSEDAFVNKMNAYAKNLKLENSNFTNTTGLHDENHYSCAKDMAIISQKLLEVGGKKLLEITSTYEDYIREDQKDKFWLVNTNKLIRQYEGVDGLKTGFTSEALSCISVTALKNNIRYIVVVMKEPTSKIRNEEVKELLNYCYSIFEQKNIYKKDTKITTKNISYSNEKKVNLICEEDVNLIYKKRENIEIASQEIEWMDKIPPFKKGDRLAKLKIELSDGSNMVTYLVAKENITMMNYFDMFKQGISYYY